MNDSFMESLLAKAEQALLTVKNADEYIPDDTFIFGASKLKK